MGEFWDSGFSEVVFGVFLKLKASLEGFEPTTHCLEGSCSIQLSYRDQVKFTIWQYAGQEAKRR